MKPSQPQTMSKISPSCSNTPPQTGWRHPHLSLPGPPRALPQDPHHPTCLSGLCKCENTHECACTCACIPPTQRKHGDSDLPLVPPTRKQPSGDMHTTQKGPGQDSLQWWLQGHLAGRSPLNSKDVAPPGLMCLKAHRCSRHPAPSDLGSVHILLCERPNDPPPHPEEL